MPQLRTLRLRFPSGGLDRRHGFVEQTPYTTADCNNVWPTEWATGRERGGTRPGLTTTSLSVGTPYNWAECTFLNSASLIRGVSVTHSGGTRVLYVTGGAVATFGGGDFITTDPGTDFCSSATYLGHLFQASAAATSTELRYIALSGSAGAGTAISSAPGYVGTAPQGCGIVCAHLDSIWLAGDLGEPHVVYRSRQGAFYDWDTAEVDPGASWNSSGPEGGIISEPITALLSHGNECLLVGCTDSLYTILGNPKAGGRTKMLSRRVGPLMQAAWCKGPDDRTYMMTRDGLYRINEACGSFPYSISAEVLPAELRHIDPGVGDYVAIGYDQRFRGVHIYVDKASGTDVHFFYNLQEDRYEDPPKGGFWPMSFGAGTMRLCPDLKTAQSATKSALLPIVAGGTIYQFDTASAESIDSYLDYGPIKLAQDGREGILYSARAALSEESGSVAWSVRKGHTPTEAFAASAAFTGANWTRSSAVTMNYAQYPKVRGAAAYLRVEDVSQSKVSLEEILLEVGDGGRMRTT